MVTAFLTDSMKVSMLFFVLGVLVGLVKRAVSDASG